LNDIERNITSSNVEFLQGRDEDEDLECIATRKIKGKPESTSVEHVLTSDLSGLQTDIDYDHDVDMNDIMLVLIK
jgi:hypothetical protein